MSIIPYDYVVKSCILLVPYLIIVFQFEPTLHYPTRFFFYCSIHWCQNCELFYLQVYYIISFGTDQLPKFTFCVIKRVLIILQVDFELFIASHVATPVITK